MYVYIYMYFHIWIGDEESLLASYGGTYTKKRERANSVFGTGYMNFNADHIYIYIYIYIYLYVYTDVCIYILICMYK
jgi:hypothetical protein